MQAETKNCQSCKNQFTIEPEDFDFYRKIDVPPPTWCPPCRMRRRFTFRNERLVYRRKSDFTGEMIFSGYSPDCPFKVYEKSIWDSDKWDPLDYGKDYDFGRSFFEQFQELHLSVPRPALAVTDMVNSDYSNNGHGARNCYLMFNFQDSENCRYGTGVNLTKDSIDLLTVFGSELIYDSFNIHDSNRVFYSINCESSQAIYFSKDLSSCNNCYGSVGLRGKSYCIWNEQYTKEEYFAKLSEMNLGSRSFVKSEKQKAIDFWKKFPSRYLTGLQNFNVTGEYIAYSKNVKNSWLIEGGENVRYSQFLYSPTSKDSYDHTLWGDNVQLTYEVSQSGLNTNNMRFCSLCWSNVSNAEYSIFCLSSSDLFGCVGLKNKKYCILNKQYSKEEYMELVPKIREHMMSMPFVDRMGRVFKYGEFFPMEFSPWAYNETLAQDFFPMTEEAVLGEGLRWQGPVERGYSITKMGSEILDRIEDVKDEVTSEIIGCEHKGDCADGCTMAFRVLPEDLAFYKNLNIPVPDLCFACRHHERMDLRNPIELYKRSCDCGGPTSKNQAYVNQGGDHRIHALNEPCESSFETAYSPDRPEIVYCEQCYQQEVA